VNGEPHSLFPLHVISCLEGSNSVRLYFSKVLIKASNRRCYIYSLILVLLFFHYLGSRLRSFWSNAGERLQHQAQSAIPHPIGIHARPSFPPRPRHDSRPSAPCLKQRTPRPLPIAAERTNATGSGYEIRETECFRGAFCCHCCGAWIRGVLCGWGVKQRADSGRLSFSFSLLDALSLTHTHSLMCVCVCVHVCVCIYRSLRSLYLYLPCETIPCVQQTNSSSS
jgi:hypothetical protein